jgi:hypothetical protein
MLQTLCSTQRFRHVFWTEKVRYAISAKPTLQCLQNAKDSIYCFIDILNLVGCLSQQFFFG